MKINELQIENVKRIKAVAIKPTQSGLTVIGGKNRQGKTSVLDAIAWALGGEDFRPSEAAREGSATPPHIRIRMSNGLLVERKGKNSALKVTDPSGQKAGQQLLNTFVEKLAINLPKFMEASGKEKARTLLQIIGVGPQLAELEQREKELYQERLYVGRTADQKEKFAAEQPYYPDAPEEPVSAADLIRMQQEILARNGENQRKRDRLKEITFEKYRVYDEIQRLEQQIADLKERMTERKAAYEKVSEDESIAMRDAADLKDESTAELEDSINHIDAINRKVRANLDKAKAEDDAKVYRDQYTQLSQDLEQVRSDKRALLDSADLPLPDLAVQDGELVYHGQKWDNMSGADQLKVSTAIVRKLNPECGFVLLDKLEQMDLDSLEEFGAWLEAEGLQAIATRVSTGDECSIIIEDGYAITDTKESVKTEPVKDWNSVDF